MSRSHRMSLCLVGLMAASPAHAECVYAGDKAAFITCMNDEITALRAELDAVVLRVDGHDLDILALTPNRVVADDIFGAVARITVLGLQAPPSATALRKMAPFLSRVVDPGNPLVPDSLRAFERLLTADQGKTILNILRAALNPGPGQQEPPALVLIHVMQAVEEARSAQGGGVDRAALQSGLQSVVDFIRDDQSGLEWIYDLIRNRQVT